MASLVRTTVAVPLDLPEQVDRAVGEGKERGRNSFLVAALRRELAARERAEIDAAFVGMGDDPDYQADVAVLAEEFAESDWEAFQLAEAKG
jgi:hypothetical protein